MNESVEWLRSGLAVPESAPADAGNLTIVSRTHVTAPGLVEPLTEREFEVLQLITQGYTNREIAERLVVAVSTVRTHINNLYGKLGVKNRAQAAARARELGVL